MGDLAFPEERNRQIVSYEKAYIQCEQEEAFMLDSLNLDPPSTLC